MIWLMSALVAAVLGMLYRLVHDNEKRISHMAGMVVAMAGAMSGGLALGLAAGAVFRESLPLASLAGLTLGGGAGVLLGIPVGLMPVLDGSLSGVMGGLMGAMLSVMLDGPGLTVVATAFVILFAATGWLLLSLLHQESASLRWPDWRLNIPAVWRWGAGAIAAAALASYLTSSPAQPPRRQAEATPQQEVPITISDTAFSPGRLALRSGEPVRLLLINAGRLEHVVRLQGLSLSDPQVSHHSQATVVGNQMAPPPVVGIQPGERVAVTVVAGALLTGEGGPAMLEDRTHGLRLIIDVK